jgi:hypothetical protein
MERYDAFVSYSRADEKLVKAVVDILRVGGRRIFWTQQRLLRVSGGRTELRMPFRVHRSS